MLSQVTDTHDFSSMAIQKDAFSMQKEAFKEMIEVADYCFTFDKSKDPRWTGYVGCYGYPTALILLSIIDSVGSIVEGGGDDTKTHFKVINNPKYYNLNLNSTEIEVLRSDYRNRLSHNSYMEAGIGLSLGYGKCKIIEFTQNKYWINLEPFLKISIEVVSKILEIGKPRNG